MIQKSRSIQQQQYSLLYTFNNSNSIDTTKLTTPPNLPIFTQLAYFSSSIFGNLIIHFSSFYSKFYSNTINNPQIASLKVKIFYLPPMASLLLRLPKNLIKKFQLVNLMKQKKVPFFPLLHAHSRNCHFYLWMRKTEEEQKKTKE